MSDNANPDWFRKALEWPTSDYSTRYSSHPRHSSIPERDSEDVWEYFTHRPAYIPPYVLGNKPPSAIPPKPRDAGSFEHTMYVPEWTDPNYIPSRHMPDSVTTLRQTLRPAQLATDAIKNPTPFAKRFGIYPWGTDGRSLLTPTREYNVTVPPPGVQGALDGMRGVDACKSVDDGNVATPATRTMPASALVKEFVDLARAKGKTLDDLLDELERTLPDLTDDQRITARAMLNIRVAQDWQSILLGDLTSDEWVGDKIFEISDEVYGTPGTNAIHPIFQRQMWRHGDTKVGTTPAYPRYMYNVNGRRGEWNPHKDDWLWDRLQPVLRHVSRLWEFLTEHDSKWRALLDPFTRARVSQGRDPRNLKSKIMCPLTTFSSGPREHMPGRHPLADKLGAHIDGPAKTLELLQDSLQFKFSSANHFDGLWHFDGPRVAYGSSHAEADKDPEAELPFKIIVYLAADFMHPLLHDGYQASEKMMAVHSMSMTILHELAHCVNIAHFSWLRNPGPKRTMPWCNSRALKKLAVYGRWLYGPLGEGYQQEPYFEDEHMAELGFSMENAVFGGYLWGMTEWAGDSWANIAAMPSGVRLKSWPVPGCREPRSYDQDDSAVCQANWVQLKNDRRATNSFQVLVPWPTVAKLQTDEFWSVQVQKFGSTALRLAPDANTKAFNKTVVHDIDHALTEAEDDAEFDDLQEKDLPEESKLVSQFLMIQVAELKRYSSMHGRWEAEIAHLTHHMRKTGAIHCLLRVYLQAVGWYKEWTSSRTGTLRWNSVYREYKEQMRTFRDIVGEQRPEDDASARPRWLPPALAGKIKSAEGLRDTLAELQQEGSGQLLPLAKEAVHMINEVIIRAESFLADLWKFPDDKREVALRVGREIQDVFRSALGKCNEVVETALVPIELDLTSSGLLAQALATSAKIKGLRSFFMNLEVVPSNALDMLTCVQNLTKSRRLVSDRWVRAARSELLCLDSEEQQRAEEVLKWLREFYERTTATQVPKPGMADKIDEWEKLMSNWEGGGLEGESKPSPGPSQSQGEDDSDESEEDVFDFFLKRRRGKDGRRQSRKQKTAGESRVPTISEIKKRHREEGEDVPEAKKQKAGDWAELKAGAWRAPNPAGGTTSSFGWRTGGLKLLSPKELGLRNPRLPHSSAFTDGTFSNRSSDSPFRGLSPTPGSQSWQAAGGGAAETEAAVQPMFGPSAMDVPATFGMFPYPYALNATTTADLAFVRPAASKASNGLRVRGNNSKKLANNKLRNGNDGDSNDEFSDDLSEDSNDSLKFELNGWWEEDDWKEWEEDERLLTDVSIYYDSEDDEA